MPSSLLLLSSLLLAAVTCAQLPFVYDKDAAFITRSFHDDDICTSAPSQIDIQYLHNDVWCSDSDGTAASWYNSGTQTIELYVCDPDCYNITDVTTECSYAGVSNDAIIGECTRSTPPYVKYEYVDVGSDGPTIAAGVLTQATGIESCDCDDLVSGSIMPENLCHMGPCQEFSPNAYGMVNNRYICDPSSSSTWRERMEVFCGNGPMPGPSGASGKGPILAIFVVVFVAMVW